jgi:hypothetical protein
MSIFAVLAPLDNARIGPAIEATFPGKFTRIWNGQWFVSAPGTTKELCDQLGITDGTNGTAVVVSVASYWGRAHQDIWEWLSSRMEKK